MYNKIKTRADSATIATQICLKILEKTNADRIKINPIIETPAKFMKLYKKKLISTLGTPGGSNVHTRKVWSNHSRVDEYTLRYRYTEIVAVKLPSNQ